MIIHSFDRFGEIADFDPVTGTLTPGISNADDLGEIHSPVVGHYAFLAGNLVVLYRMLGVLTLRIGQTVVALDDAVSVLYRRSEGMCEITASTAISASTRSDDAPPVHIEYPAPHTIVSLEDDPTPFVEAEDFDFGLFVSNVFNNPKRRSAIYRTK